MGVDTRTIAGEVGTSPDNTALSGGTVTTQTDTSTLIYTGTDDLNAIFRQGQMAIGGLFYIYASTASGTYKIAEVTGLYQVSLTGATYVFNIQLNKPLEGLTGASVAYIYANLLGYSWVNNGSGDGTISTNGEATGQTVVAGQFGDEPQLAPASARTNFWPPVLYDASSTSFFITENS